MNFTNFRNLILGSNRVVLSALISALVVIIINVLNLYVIIALISLIIIKQLNMRIKN